MGLQRLRNFAVQGKLLQLAVPNAGWAAAFSNKPAAKLATDPAAQNALPAPGIVSMSGSLPHVSVCVCTMRRPALLKRLMIALEEQWTDHRLTYSVIVADNDAKLSARSIVAEVVARGRIQATYCCEPRQNIALARNKAMACAKGEYVATIDDDEFPEPDWLLRMVQACEEYRAAGVLGPVRPHFDEPPPSWIIKGRFCERPEHATGREMRWRESRTGNLLFRRRILDDVAEAFNHAFDTGGEDQGFFMRMMQRGHVFRWCNEGIIHETVPKFRWTRAYMLKRALLRGRNSLKHREGRARLLAHTVAALPAYSLMLPFAFLFGQHIFMKCCVRLCDHAGRALTLIGLNPVRDWQG